MSKITPFLWYDHEAEEAAELYVKTFNGRPGGSGGSGGSKILSVSRHGEAGPGPAGSAMTVNFVLEGQEVIALNAGPQYPHTEAFSFFVSCESQEEVDYFWDALTADGGEESMCGWLKDRYGLSWQIVPTELMTLLGDPDPARSKAATEAMLQMRKIDIEGLRRAAAAA